MKCSSVNERIDMIKVFFFEKRIEWMTMLDGLKKKDVWDEIQSSTKKMRFDWFSSKQRRFFIVESIDQFDSWAIHEDSLSWFS